MPHGPASPGERPDPDASSSAGASSRATRARRTCWIVFAALAITITALDLWTKAYFFGVLQAEVGPSRDGHLAIVSQEPITVIPKWFEFEANINYGAFSGWFWGRTWFLITLSVGALFVIAWFLWTHVRGPGPHGVAFAAALGLLWGGTCGNLYDRAMYGYVRDFIKWFYVSSDGRPHVWPNFNIADSAICTGVTLILLVFMLEGRKPEGAAKK